MSSRDGVLPCASLDLARSIMRSASWFKNPAVCSSCVIGIAIDAASCNINALRNAPDHKSGVTLAVISAAKTDVEFASAFTTMFVPKRSKLHT